MGRCRRGSRNTDDPEQKDASLSLESRVRPWVVDDETERLVEDTLESLEKALTCLSPVKGGLGAGPLDHVYGDDQGVDMFLANLANLKAQERARESSLPGCGDQLAPIGEMLEKFYRETMDSSVKSSSEPAFSEPVDDEEDLLANDPDVARLLAEVQESCEGECSRGPESETGEEGGTGGKDVSGVRQEDKVDAVGQENSPREYGATSATTRRRHHDENGLQQQQQQAGSSCGTDGIETGNCRERGGQNNGGTVLLEHSEISTATEAASTTQSQQGSIDISRIKIDGLGSAGRSEHRSCSVPSICLSAGGCSRLSRTSTMSSYTLARAASQKLLEATKEAAEQASTDQKNEAVETPHRAAGSAIAKADERINVVRQNAEALQARMSLKRTSYLKSRRPQAVSWRRHETNFSRAKPCSCRRRIEGAPRSTTTTGEHQRQPPSTGAKPRGPTCRFKGSLSTPLLSAAEAAFVLGTKEDEVLTEKSPSLRQTTLGRMLRRAASLSTVAASSPRSDASEHSILRGHHPSDAEKISGARLSGGGNRGERLLDNPLRVKSVFARPPSAAPVGQEPSSTAVRMRTRSSAVAAAAAATRHRERGPHAESPRHETPIMISPFSEREASIIATKDRFHGEQGTDSPRRTNKESAVRKRLPRSVHKALEAALLAASVDTAVSPREQFVSARKIIADMKRLNTRDSVGDLLISPALLKQGASESSATHESWSTETSHRYR